MPEGLALKSPERTFRHRTLKIVSPFLSRPNPAKNTRTKHKSIPETWSTELFGNRPAFAPLASTTLTCLKPYTEQISNPCSLFRMFRHVPNNMITLPMKPKAPSHKLFRRFFLCPFQKAWSSLYLPGVDDEPLRLFLVSSTC